MTDLFQQNNIKVDGDLFEKNGINTNKKALQNNVQEPSSQDIGWKEKLFANLLVNSPAVKVMTMNKKDPLSWFELALRMSPMGAPLQQIDNTKNAIIEDKNKKRKEISDKYGVDNSQPLQITDGMIQQMQAEGKRDFVENLQYNGINNSIPFLSGYASISEKLDVNNIAKKIDNGEDVSLEEMEKYNLFMLEQAETAYRGTTIGGKTIDVISHIPAFAGEFLATGGIGSIGRSAVQQTLTKGLQQAGKKEIGKRLVRGTAETMGDAALRLPLGMPHMVIENYQDRRLTDGLTITAKGQWLLKESQEKPYMTFLKAFGDGFIEVFSEMSGGGLRVGASIASRTVVKNLPKGTVKELYKFAKKITPPERWSQMLSKTGFNGILEEYGEERLGNLLRALTGVDDRDIPLIDKLIDAVLPDKEQALVEIGAFGVWGGTSYATLSLADKLLARGVPKEEVENVLQSTSELEKEEILEEFEKQEPLKGRIEYIEKKSQEVYDATIKAGFDEKRAEANATLHKGVLHKALLKWGEEWGEKGVDFQPVLDRLTFQSIGKIEKPAEVVEKENEQAKEEMQKVVEENAEPYDENAEDLETENAQTIENSEVKNPASLQGYPIEKVKKLIPFDKNGNKVDVSTLEKVESIDDATHHEMITGEFYKSKEIKNTPAKSKKVKNRIFRTKKDDKVWTDGKWITDGNFMILKNKIDVVGNVETKKMDDMNVNWNKLIPSDYKKFNELQKQNLILRKDSFGNKAKVNTVVFKNANDDYVLIAERYGKLFKGCKFVQSENIYSGIVVLDDNNEVLGMVMPVTSRGQSKTPENLKYAEEFTLYQTGENIENYKEFVNKVLDKKLTKSEKGKPLNLGKTPAKIVEAGVPENDLTIGSSVIEKAQDNRNPDHNLSKETISNVYEALLNPIAIVESGTDKKSPNKTRIAAVVDLQNDSGDYVMVAIEVNKRTGKTIVNDIRSIHSRNDFTPMLENALKEGRLLKVDKSKIKDLPPFKNFELISKRSSKSIDSISEREKIFKSWFGDSKVVDENGKPLIVYHGTNAEFDTFDKNKINKGFFGKGLYFNSDADYVRPYGKNNMQVYLQINKPYIDGNSKDLRNSEFIEDLKNQGYDGIIKNFKNGTSTYVVFNPEQIKSVDNIGTFDAENPNIYFQNSDVPENIKGMYMRKMGKSIIEILETADESTMPHELAHFYLDVITLASQHSETAQDDLRAINKMLGHTDTKPYTIEEHELFAKTFEKYLRDGQAPNSFLAKAFDNFKEWLAGIVENFELNDIQKDALNRLFMTDEEYEEYIYPKYKANEDLINAIAESDKLSVKFNDKINNVSKDWKKFYDALLIPIETRLGKITPVLKNVLRQHTFALLNLQKKDSEKIAPFLKAVEKLKKDKTTVKISGKEVNAYAALTMGLNNRDNVITNTVLKQTGLNNEFQEIRGLLDELHNSALSVGIDVNFLQSYFPRLVKRNKTDNFIELFEKMLLEEEIDIKNQVLDPSEAQYSNVKRSLREADPNNLWSKDDKTKFINTMIRGFGKNNVLLSRIGQLKFERQLDELTPEQQQFYEPIEVALASYVIGARKNIEERRFFGGEKRDISKLRASVKKKKLTLLDVKKRYPAQAKGKELDRLKHKLSPILIKLENFEKIENPTEDQIAFLNNLREKKERLESQIKWTDEAQPLQVKNTVIKRLKTDIKELEEKIQEIAGDQLNVENSIGAWVDELSQKGIIHAKDESQVKDLLVARFNAGRLNGFGAWLRDVSTIVTLNDITNAITQFGDLTFAAQKFGILDTLAGMRKVEGLSKKSLGLENIAEEFKSVSQGSVSKWLNTQLKVIGLELIDGFGKNTVINASVHKARRLAKKNDEKFNEKLKDLFENKANEVKQDLIDNKITDDILFIAFNDLADIQPITADQMTENYQKGGFYRMLYALKTYSIKALDILRNECFMKISEGKKLLGTDKKQAYTLIGQGLNSLVKMQLFLWLFGVPKDLLKDFISNKEFDYPDYFIDNLVIFGIFNRYLVNKSIENPVNIWQENLKLPAAQAIGDVYSGTKQVIEGKKELGEIYAWSRVPLVGKLYYNWLGGSTTKREEF